MKLPYDELGSGRPLVLLHAGVADRTMWQEHLGPLAAAGYRVIAPDLSGFGQAHVEPGEQAPWNDVLETMAALGVDRPVLLGNSFGGAVALRVAVVAPAAVSGLVLISTPPPDLEPSPELAAAWEAEEAALKRGDTDGAVEAVLDAWTQPDAPAQLRERVAEMQRGAFVLQAEAAGIREAPDPLEQDPAALARVDVPTLVAGGERDFVEFRHGAEMLARLLPRARHVTIAGAGHLAPLETPEEFRELVLAFLSEEEKEAEGASV